MWGQILAGAGSYLMKSKKASTQAKWDKYNNTMTALQAAQSANTITQNVALNREQHAANKVQVATGRLMAVAKVKAGAAAAGVTGGSVESTLFGIGRNAGLKIASETQRFDTSIRTTDQQRKNVALQAQMATKAITQQPSLLGAISTTAGSIAATRIDTPTSGGTALEGGTPAPETGMLSDLRTALNLL